MARQANEDGRLRTSLPTTKRGANTMATRSAAVGAWREIARALAASDDKLDRDLAQAVAKFVGEMPAVKGAERAGVSRVPFEPIRQADLDHQR